MTSPDKNSQSEATLSPVPFPDTAPAQSTSPQLLRNVSPMSMEQPLMRTGNTANAIIQGANNGKFTF
jgi:hypothetical protein